MLARALGTHSILGGRARLLGQIAPGRLPKLSASIAECELLIRLSRASATPYFLLKALKLPASSQVDVLTWQARSNRSL